MKTRLMLTAAGAALGLAFSAAAETPRNVLPIPQAPFRGVINETVQQSTPSPTPSIQAPAGAPNFFVFLGDDVGFGMSSTFGGPVPTPNMDRLAAGGERYNRFHTTAICSPTRAALLTGRNHHNAGVGHLTDLPSDYPGYTARIPASTATVAQTLRLNGYNTAMFGKHHDIPSGEDTPAGPFDLWPTGLGFEYFFGFPTGDVHQWRPNLYRGVTRLPDLDGPPVLVEKRLADDAISWVHNQKAAAPDKPFFIYYASGATHAPHHAPPDYIARFKGQFDQGWDQVREETLKRQIAMGLVPRGTKMSPRPADVPAWSSLSADQRAFAIRSMEVAAAMLAYQDAQLGRVLAELDRMGELDKTLVVIIQGDNGASAEAGPPGTVNEISHLSNGLKEDDAWLAANVDRLGGEYTYASYPGGWAWAMNTPFPWTKQYASMLGGIRNGMIMSWKGHVGRPGTVCAEFGHVVDIAPTLLEAAGVPAPHTVYGVEQKPMDGRSLLPSLAACQPDRSRTQYFEITGKVGLYKDGWFLSGDDGRKPWEQAPPAGYDPTRQAWSLYDLRRDFAQATDVSAQHPQQVAALVETWREEARRNNVFPLDHRFSGGRGRNPFQTGKAFDYWGSDVSLPAFKGPMFAGRSFTLDAEFKLDRPDASGAIFALGSRFAGFSLYLDQGRPALAYALSTKPEDTTLIRAATPLPAGAGRLRLAFTSEGFGKGADAQILLGDEVIASGHIPRAMVMPAGLGEMLDIGRDTGVPVIDHATPHGKLEGDVSHVALRFK